MPINDPTEHGELKGDDQILAEGKTRWKACADYNSSIHTEAESDNNFLAGNQWDSKAKENRENEGRPVLVFNRLNPFVNQIKNDLISNMPDVLVRATDNENTKVARVVNGLIRNILNNIDGRSAITWAITGAVRCGIGFYRVKAEHLYNENLNPDLFVQDLCLERVEDPTQVYFPIPLCKAQDLSDAPYAMIRTLISKREYKDKWPDKWSEYQSWEKSSVDASLEWSTEEGVWLCEYFRVEYQKYTAYMLSDGSVVDSIKDLPEGITVIKEREINKRKIMRYLMSAASILEKSEIPSQYIPIVPVFGDEIIANGKKSYKSLIRDAKPIQQMYNWHKNHELEGIALSTKAPWIVAQGQVDAKSINDWRASNVKNISMLTYQPISYPNGAPLPPPVRTQPPAIDQATVLAANEAIDNLKAIIGIYDASLGAQGNEQSGKAIIARQRQANTSNGHFYESLTRSLRHTGRILISMIPSYYDIPRIIRILGPDMQDDVIKINQQYMDPKTGNTLYFDLSQAYHYDITVDTGPSYQTRRMENAQNILSLVQANPNMFNLLGDILVQNLDWEGADRASKRIKATIPPNVLAAEDSDDMDPNKINQLQQQLQMLMQKSQMDDQVKAEMQQLINNYQIQIKSKTDELMNKVHITDIKAQAELGKAQLGLAAEKIKQQTHLTQHAADAAVTLHTQGQQSLGLPPELTQSVEPDISGPSRLG